MKKSTTKTIAASIFTVSLAAALAVFAFACYQKIQGRDLLSADLFHGQVAERDAESSDELAAQNRKSDRLENTQPDAAAHAKSDSTAETIKPLSDPLPTVLSNDSSQNFNAEFFDKVIAAPKTTPKSELRSKEPETETDSEPVSQTDTKSVIEPEKETEPETEIKPKNAGRRVKSPDAIFGKPIVGSIRGKCVSCSDGDTLTILVGKETFRVRLDSVDCPESAQAYGQKAKLALSQLVHGKDVIVHATGKDDYGRTLAFVIVRRINVSERLIKTGMGWHYKQYSDSAELSRLQEKARKDKLGLWADNNPTPPWNWRRAESSKKR